MDSLLGTFHISLSGIIFQMINFGIVFVVLYFFAIKPLLKILDTRTKTIQEGLSYATKHEELLKETEAMYKQELEKARKEAHEIVSAAKKDAESKRDEILLQTRTDTERMIREGKSQLEQEKEDIINEAKRQMADTVVSAAEKALDDVFIGTDGLDQTITHKRIIDHVS